MDKHWKEVMDLAQKYGFIVQACGGVALLATHANQKEHLGETKFNQIQEMNEVYEEGSQCQKEGSPQI